jgi:hypothetical protein
MTHRHIMIFLGGGEDFVHCLYFVTNVTFCTSMLHSSSSKVARNLMDHLCEVISGTC